MHRFSCIFVPVWLSLPSQLSDPRPDGLSRLMHLSSCCPIRSARLCWLAQLKVWPSQLEYPHSYLLIPTLYQLAVNEINTVSLWSCRPYAPAFWRDRISSRPCIDRSLFNTIHHRATAHNQWGSFIKLSDILSVRFSKIWQDRWSITS